MRTVDVGFVAESSVVGTTPVTVEDGLMVEGMDFEVIATGPSEDTAAENVSVEVTTSDTCRVIAVRSGQQLVDSPQVWKVLLQNPLYKMHVISVSTRTALQAV